MIYGLSNSTISDHLQWLLWRTTPNCLFPLGDRGPHLKHGSLRPSNSVPQMQHSVLWPRGMLSCYWWQMNRPTTEYVTSARLQTVWEGKVEGEGKREESAQRNVNSTHSRVLRPWTNWFHVSSDMHHYQTYGIQYAVHHWAEFQRVQCTASMYLTVYSCCQAARHWKLRSV